MVDEMDVHTPPTISSFVVRFVVEAVSVPQDSPVDPALPTANPPYRGSIRHIQTDEEMNFSTWQDAVAFIRRFVPLEKDEQQA